MVGPELIGALVVAATGALLAAKGLLSMWTKRAQAEAEAAANPRTQPLPPPKPPTPKAPVSIPYSPQFLHPHPIDEAVAQRFASIEKRCDRLEAALAAVTQVMREDLGGIRGDVTSLGRDVSRMQGTLER